MDFLQPTTWAEALALRAERLDALPIAGGTDVMVDLNFDRRRPGALLALGRVAELREWGTQDERIRLGAGVPYARVIDELGPQLPGLAMASRTVGSPQIRIRGTVGGNLGSASPAGDAHPPLLAAGALVELASVRGTRRVPVAEFFTGPKRSVLAADELIAAVLVPPDLGPQQFAKVGTRNAMVIAVCSFAVAVHTADRRVGTGIGSAAPTPRREGRVSRRRTGCRRYRRHGGAELRRPTPAGAHRPRPRRRARRVACGGRARPPRCRGALQQGRRGAR